MSTMLLTRAPNVDLLKHLHPRHFSVGMICNGYTICPKMGNALKSSCEISSHHSLQREKRETILPETRTFDARRSRQRKTISYQTNLNSISSHTKSNSCQFSKHNHKRTWNQRCSFQSVLGRVRNHQVKLKTYEVGSRIRNKNIPSFYIEDQTSRNFWSPVWTFSLSILSVSPQWKHR